MSESQLLFVDDMRINEDSINEIIINERNKEILRLEQDFTDLRDSMDILSVLVLDQGENLDVSETNLEETKIHLNEANQVLEKIPDKKELLIRNVKIASGIVIGGLLLGGVGSVFGIIPGLVGAAIGSSSAAIVAGISNLVK